MSTRTHSRNDLFARFRRVLSPAPTRFRSERSHGIEPLETRIAPAAGLSVIKVDAFAPGGDLDGDGKADLGDTIRYSVTITNTGDIDLTGVTFEDLLDPNTTLVGAVNVSPLAINDAFSTVGNTLLRVGAAGGSGPAVSVVGNVLANDRDFLGDTFVISGFAASSANGGTVSMITTGPNAGSFSYLPAAGYTGTDTFTYTIRDSGMDGIAGNADDLESTGTVSITVSGMVWYVDNSAGTNGDGRSGSPFNSLAGVSGAGGSGDADGPGDTIYLRTGSGSYNGGLVLEANQTLHGEGTALVVNGFALQAAGSAPTITNTAAGGAGITLASGNIIKSINIANTAGAGVTGSNITGATFDNLNVTTAGGAGVSLTNFSGAFNVAGATTITNPAGAGIAITSAVAGASFDFGNTNISAAGGASVGHGVSISSTSGATFTFDSLVISSENGGGIVVGAGSGAANTLNIGGSANTITTTGGAAIDLAKTAIQGTAAFSNVKVNSSPGTGINLDGVSGTLNIAAGAIGSAAGNDIDISGGSLGFSYGGTVTNTAGRAIEITNHSGGNITFSGNISDTNGAGILLQGNTSGIIAFTGALALNTGANIAVNLNNNTGATVNFSGDLDITTTSGTGFTAIGGGTVNVTGATNTISAGSGTALNFADTSIGSSGLRFQSISSGAGSNVGIRLVNTGASGGLTVTGVDGADAGTVADAGTGGTISGKTGADGLTTSGIGIYLENTRNVSLAGMVLSNFDNFAIRGQNVTNFALSGTTISGNSGTTNAFDEGAISFTNLGGVASIYDSNISGAREFTVSVINTNTSLTQFAIGRTTLGAMQVGQSDDALHFEGFGSGTMNLLVHDSTFTSAAGDLINANAADTVTMDVQLLKNTFNNQYSNILSGGGGITITAGGIGSNTHLTYNISGNSFRGAKGHALLIAKTMGAGDAYGTVFNNTFGVAGVAGSASVEASAINIDVRGSGSHTVLIKNNTIRNWGANGAIQLFANQGSATMNATLLGNITAEPGSQALSGLYAEVGALSGDTNVLNLKVGGTGAERNDFTAGDPANIADVYLGRSLSGTPTFNLSKGVSASTSPALIISDNNTGPVVTLTGGTINAVTTSPTLPAPIDEGIPTPQPLLFAPSDDYEPAPVLPPSEQEAVTPTPSETLPSDPSSGGSIVTPDPTPVIVDDGVLSQAELDLLVEAAIARWTATGLSAEQIALLNSVRFEVADLSGWYLGSTAPGVVRLDSNAGGNAWFIDATPLDDVEFTGTGTQLAAKSGVAANRIDALTTVMHELGHVLGLEDSYLNGDRADLMYGSLTLGERRLPVAGEAAGAVPHEHSGPDFLFSPIAIGTLPVGKSVTITFDAKVNDSFTNPLPQISNQGTVSGTNFSSVLTDDPSITGASNPTVTPVDLPDVTVSLNPVSVVEDGAGNLVYTFTRQGPTTASLVVNFSLGGTASRTGDYTVNGATSFDSVTGNGTLTFLAGSDTVTVTIDPTADSTTELDETVSLTLQSGTGYDVGTSGAQTGTIVNDDTDITVAVTPGSVSEDGAQNLIYTFTRAGALAGTLTVNFTVGGSAVFGSDYTQTGATSFSGTVGTVTFADGQTTATVTINPTADTTVEGDETAILTVASGTGYNIGGASIATGTITNDDADVTLSISPNSVVEDGAGNLVYTFTRTGYTAGALTVGFTVGGSATYVTDYAQSGAASFGSGAGTITFAPGVDTVTVIIDPVAETDGEFDETVVLTLTGGAGYNVTTPGAITGTISNDDTAVTVAVDTASLAENALGGFVYTFTRTGDTGTDLLVSFNIGGTASFTSDYTAAGHASFNGVTGTVLIPAGAASAAVTLTPVNDRAVEGSETAVLTVVNGPSYGAGVANTATGTIIDNDFATVSLVSNTSTVGEGAGTHNVGVQLVITADGTGTASLERAVTVNLADFLIGSASGSGVASDYSFTSPQTVTFASGAISSTQNVAIAIVNDARVEGNETIALVLGGPGGFVDGTSGQVSLSGTLGHTVTITDNDFAAVSLVSNTSSVGEGAGTHNVGVQLVITANGTGTASLEREVKVNLSDLLSGSAAGAGVDYSFTSPQTVTFASGATNSTQNVAVTLVNDARVEGNETIALQLGSLVDGTAGQVSLTGNANHTVTITDNDFATVSLVSNTSSVGEGAGTHNVGVQLVITANGTGTPSLEREVKVNLSDLLSGSAAGAGVDYSFTSPQTVTFASGATSSTQNVAITLVNDARVEGNETIALQLGGLNDGTAGQVSLTGSANHTVTITDNDFATVSLVSNTSSVGEGAGTHNVGVQLVITANGTGTPSLEREVKVNLSDLLSGSAAGAGVDYSFTSPQMVTFASGATSSTQNVAITLVNDARVEGNESIALQLGNLVDGTAGQVSLTGNANHTVTITDNDFATVSLVSNTSSVGEGAGTHNVGVQLVITANGTGTPSLEREVKVNLSDLLSGSAAGAGVDYSFTSPQTVTFASGATSSTQNVAITLVNDARVEGNETIALQLGGLNDGTAGQVSLTGNANHTVTITDNDFATVSLVSNTSSVGEGAGTHNVGVQLVITANGTGTPSLEREVKVNLSDLLSGSAAGAGVDYSFTSPQTVTFASGATSSTQNVAITLVNDARVEGNETIALQLGGLNDGTAGQVSLTGSANHTVTITDNDFATVSLVSNTSSVGEGGGTHSVGVQLVITANGTGTPSLEREVKVNLSDLLSGSAAGAGVDYSFTSPQTVTFASGATSSTQNVAITLVNDARVEGNETIALQLGNLVDGTAGQVSLTGNANHTVTITDNDFATVSLVSNTSSVGEGGGTHSVGVQLVITANGTGTPSLEREVKVNLSDLLSGSAAGAGVDYSFTSPQTVTFASGATSSTQNVAVTLVNDARVEGNETIALQLGNLVDGTAGQVSLTGNANHTVTITDNDFATVSLVSNTSSVGEGAGTHNVGVQLVITANGTGTPSLEREVKVNLSDLLSGSAAGAGVDYSFTSPQTVTFAVGETSSTKNVPISITNDLLSEGNESINLELNTLTHNAGSQITLGASTSHVVTIIDNDVDLRVTKTESVETVIAGSGAGNLTYTVTVKNIGLTNATGVVVAENLTLPAGVSILSITPSAGAFTVTSTPDGNWAVGDLAVGAEATLTVVLTVDATAAEGLDVISNTASLTAADQVIVNLVDDVASQSTSVDRQVDLQITKDDGVTTITPGETLSYVLNVRNTGPSNATGVVITEFLPAGTTFNAGASTAGWIETAPGVFTLNLGTVAGNSSATPVTFAVNVLYPAETGLNTVENTATVTDDSTAGPDLNGADNTATDSNVLDASPELSLTITDDISATVARGGLVRYTLTYANTGSQHTSGVYLIEHVPANATFDPFASDGNWVLQQDGSYRLEIGDLAAGEAPQSVIFAVRVNTTVPAGVRELVNTALIDDNGNNSAEDLMVSATEHTLHYQGIYVVAPGVALPKKGAPAIVRVFDIATETELSSFVAYENYKDSVRVAVGDFNGDGFDDIVTSSRTGTGQVRVFDGLTGERLPIGEQMQLDPFNGKKEKGAYIAVGDVTGDGRDDIIVGSALGGSKVKIYDGLTGGLVNEYNAFAKSYRGGVRLAVADVNDDGVDDVVAGQGNFGRTARVFDAASDIQLQQIQVGGKNYRGGISVAAADVNGDGKADIITGRSGKSAPWVEVFSGEDQSSLGRFLAFEAKFRNGIRVAAADVNVDGIADIIVGAGYKGGSRVGIFDGSGASGFAEIHNFVAFPSYPAVSLFVAGTSPVPIIASQQQIPV